MPPVARLVLLLALAVACAVPTTVVLMRDTPLWLGRPDADSVTGGQQVVSTAATLKPGATPTLRLAALIAANPPTALPALAPPRTPKARTLREWVR